MVQTTDACLNAYIFFYLYFYFIIHIFFMLFTIPPQQADLQNTINTESRRVTKYCIDRQCRPKKIILKKNLDCQTPSLTWV